MWGERCDPRTVPYHILIDHHNAKIADMHDNASIKLDNFKTKKKAEEWYKNTDKYIEEIIELPKRDKELQGVADEAQWRTTRIRWP
jgi:hypothetical protein